MGIWCIFLFVCKLPSSVVQRILSTCRLLYGRPLIECRYFFWFIHSCCRVKANNIVCNVKSLPVALHLCTLYTRKYLPSLLSFFQLIFYSLFFFVCVCVFFYLAHPFLSRISRDTSSSIFFFDLFFFSAAIAPKYTRAIQ